MNLAQTNLNAKIIIAGIIAAVLVVGLSGCGKSKAEKAAEQAAAQQAAERHDARLKFKEAIAAITVRTKGSTCEEFRQCRLGLETCYEANKSYLEDTEKQFSYLSLLMSATEYCWTYSIRKPEIPLPTQNDKEAMIYACVLRPSITNKLDYTWDQRISDRDFTPGNYVRLGLKKTHEQCDVILLILDGSN